jgi:hypothetical protein
VKIEGPKREPWPRWRVLAFMAGLSLAAGYSARCYVDQLIGETPVANGEN